MTTADGVVFQYMLGQQVRYRLEPDATWEITGRWFHEMRYEEGIVSSLRYHLCEVCDFPPFPRTRLSDEDDLTLLVDEPA